MSHRSNSCAQVGSLCGRGHGSSGGASETGGDQGEEERRLQETGQIRLDFHGKLVAEGVLDASHVASELLPARLSI